MHIVILFPSIEGSFADKIEQKRAKAGKSRTKGRKNKAKAKQKRAKARPKHPQKLITFDYCKLLLVTISYQEQKKAKRPQKPFIIFNNVGFRILIFTKN